jgi:positive regulator of sigma E activity
MAKEPQTVSDCAALRAECQKEIFKKMDDHHGQQMLVLNDIQIKAAFNAGQQKAANGWKSMIGKAMMVWGVPLLFIIILGVVYYFQKKGLS